jgi:hypothetical protein
VLASELLGVLRLLQHCQQLVHRSVCVCVCVSDCVSE